MKLAIIGHAAEKFDEAHLAAARRVIERALSTSNEGGPVDVLVSGRSPMGGIDVWAEEIAKRLGIECEIYAPTVHRWGGPGGFKERNLQIASAADHVLVIVVEKLPKGFKGMRFKDCYHCRGARPPHVKSGACWTAIQAQKLGKTAEWVIL